MGLSRASLSPSQDRIRCIQPGREVVQPCSHPHCPGPSVLTFSTNPRPGWKLLLGGLRGFCTLNHPQVQLAAFEGESTTPSASGTPSQEGYRGLSDCLHQDGAGQLGMHVEQISHLQKCCIRAVLSSPAQLPPSCPITSLAPSVSPQPCCSPVVCTQVTSSPGDQGN